VRSVVVRLSGTAAGGVEGTGAFMGRVRRAARNARRGRVASDPGLLRLRLAVRATLAVALSSAVLYVVGPAVGLPAVVAMLLGGVVGMNGSFASSSRAPRDVALTLSVFPLAAAAGAVPAALLAGHTTLHLVGFVVVMVGAVYVRRFGPRWFNYGMLAWLSYFFTTFIGITLDTLPALLAVVVCATACLVLVAAVVVPDRPAATRAAAHRSFAARVSALAVTARDVVSGALPAGQAQGRLHARSFRLVEGALILDGSLAGTDDRAAAAVRRGLLDAELAAEELASTVPALQPDRLPSAVRAGLVAALQALSDGRFGQARVAAARVRGAVDAAVPDDLAGPVRDAALAVDRLAQVLDRPAPELTGEVGAYEPAVDLYLGNLPGSAASVLEVLSTSRVGWSLNTRLCLQTAVAAPIALLLGRQLSEQRYYWAVLACFLVLTGTLTTGEATTKGLNRVLGTLAGLVAATVAVHLTGDHDAAVVGVMLVSVFLGLYFFRVSYALMTFAVTTVVGELYDVLHEFSDRLLLLRLAETVIGAGVGIAVVLVVLPVRTSEARAAAQGGFRRQLAALLGDVADRLGVPGGTPDLLLDARRLDAALHQLALVSRPGGGATLTGLSRAPAMAAVAGYTAVAYRARSLASAVAGVAPGTLPELAERSDALRRRCLGEPLRIGVPGGREGGGTDLARLVDQLEAAVDALGPVPLPEPAPA